MQNNYFDQMNKKKQVAYKNETVNILGINFVKNWGFWLIRMPIQTVLFLIT